MMVWCNRKRSLGLFLLVIGMILSAGCGDKKRKISQENYGSTELENVVGFYQVISKKDRDLGLHYLLIDAEKEAYVFKFDKDEKSYEWVERYNLNQMSEYGISGDEFRAKRADNVVFTAKKVTEEQKKKLAREFPELSIGAEINQVAYQLSKKLKASKLKLMFFIDEHDLDFTLHQANCLENMVKEYPKLEKFLKKNKLQGVLVRDGEDNGPDYLYVDSKMLVVPRDPGVENEKTLVDRLESGKLKVKGL